MICHICKREDPGAQPWGAGRQPICFDCARSDPEREAIAKMYMRERITEVAAKLAERFGVEIVDSNRSQLESLAAVQIAMPNLEILGGMGVSSRGAVVSSFGSMDTVKRRAAPRAPVVEVPFAARKCDCSFCRGEGLSFN